jgi:hypothetical protein
MKINPAKKAALAVLALAGLAVSANAQVSMNNIAVGTSNSFPTFSISGVNGSLAFQSDLTTPAGATIQGGTSQGPVTVGTGWGEIFNYSGVAATLGAIAIINNGGGGQATYQPFLFNLGPTIITTGTFNPSAQVNLLAAQTIQPGAAGSANFLEFDFAGTDAITLISGDSYAFGLVNNNGTSDMNYRRSNGAVSDPNGDGFTLSSLSATTDTSTPYSGSVRNSYIGVYTITSSPEPSTLAFLGIGLVAGVMIRRRKLA